MPHRALLGMALAMVLAAGPAAAASVFSLDQCADQYVIALAPRDAIVGVSFRAGNADSYLARQSLGLPRRRATAEAVLGAKADIVVRYWGGDARLSQVLTRRHIQVVDIEDTDSFAGVSGNIRKVALALGRPAQGEALIARMDDQLAAAAGAWRGRGALYLTPGGYTAGSGTLIHAMLAGAGLRDTAPAGYSAAPLEKMVLAPPSGLVLGFFDVPGVSGQWGPGRHRILRELTASRTLDSLPAAVLGCPGWFVGDAVQSLGDRARAGR